MIQRDSGIKSEKEEKKISYKDLIRQQIDKFLKQNSQWCYFLIKIVKTKNSSPINDLKRTLINNSK